MNKINPKKLLHSKWTSVNVQHRERHFIVVDVEFDEQDNVIGCVIEAVLNHRQQHIDWQILRDQRHWLSNWR